MSGAGPTVLAFGSSDTSVLTARCPDGWECHDLAVEPTGVTLLT